MLQNEFNSVHLALKNKGKIGLVTLSGTDFSAVAETTKSGSRAGKPVIKFYQGTKEYGRAYECCWGYSTNCYRTVIGMYSSALDSFLSGKITTKLPQKTVEEDLVVNRSFQPPTLSDKYKFLLRLYFGEGSNCLNNCIQRAYLDFNRTLHGIQSFENGADIRESASRILEDAFTDLPNTKIVNDQKSFDNWHKNLCFRLCEIYQQGGYENFCIGQAQKWLNMTMKYIYVFNDELQGYESFFPYAHMPIDNIILEKLAPYNVCKLSSAWSRIKNYEDYYNFQDWVRRSFPGSAPLSVEFHLWQNNIK